jgi:hypothetical protein
MEERGTPSMDKVYLYPSFSTGLRSLRRRRIRDDFPLSSSLVNSEGLKGEHVKCP